MANLWLRCVCGNLGAIHWIPVTGDPEAQARSVFNATRCDTAPGFDGVKLGGTFVAGYSVVQWGIRSGRFLSPVFGEVNEANYGKPLGTLTGTVGIESGGKGLPAPILKRVCSGYAGFTDSAGLRLGEDLLYYIVSPDTSAPFPVELNVKFYRTVYDFIIPDGDDAGETVPVLFLETTGYTIEYPIAELSTTGRGKYPVNPLLGVPRPSPEDSKPYGAISGGITSDFREPFLIFRLSPNGDPNPLYDVETGGGAQQGYFQHYISSFTVARNALGFGNLGVEAQFPRLYNGYRKKISIGVSFNYWRAEGRPYQEGGTVDIDFMGCRSELPKPPERSNVCVSGMDLDPANRCLTFTTCSDDGVQYRTTVCVAAGDESFLKLAIEKGATGLADSDGIFSLDIGEDLRVQYKDETGYDWDVIIP